MRNKAQHKKPCKACPFRREALPGFLGASSPERFIATSLNDDPMPCHTTMDYDDPEWKSKFESGEMGRECAGNATFFANLCKRSRDPRRLVVKPDRERVFTDPRDFITHHRSGAKSWGEFEESESKGFRFPWIVVEAARRPDK